MVRTRIVEQHVLLLGTLRADGWPRISAVECDVVDGDLCVGMVWQSTKALDLLRDPRLTAHSLPPARENPDGDLKLYGRAVTVEGARKRAYEQVLFDRLRWRPPEPYHCFALDVDSAALVVFRDNGRAVTQWRAGGPTRDRFLPDATA
jgi:hypothetical protein